MKVLILNTFDKGGAANACVRLHQGLLEECVDSKILLAYKQRNWHNSFVYIKQEIKPKLNNKVKAKTISFIKKINFFIRKNNINRKEVFLRNRAKELEWFSFPDSDMDITTSYLYSEASIINLHWVAGFLDYESFFKKNKKPVVWTLHDMNPFSGGEHFTETFLGIDEFGLPIIRKLTKEEIEVSNENIEMKMQALSKIDNLTIVSPSEWLANEARKSVVFKDKPVFCIPYGINSEIYKIRDKNYSRELLNIPIDKKVILFVADSVDNQRKGFVFLKKAFEQLQDSDLILCAIGDKNSEIKEIDNVIELGIIYDERVMSIAYSAADVFIIPSLIDNLPNTVIESLMCGTPVIGFPVGGIPEMIKDGVNGLIIDDIGVNSLTKAIDGFFKNRNSFNRIKISDDAFKKYDQKIQAQKYKDLFSEILNEK